MGISKVQYASTRVYPPVQVSYPLSLIVDLGFPYPNALVTDRVHTDNVGIFAAAAGDISKDISTGLCTGSQPNMDFHYNTSIWSVSHLAASITLSRFPRYTLLVQRLSDKKPLPAQQTAANIHPRTTSPHPAPPEQ